jgi:DNA repair protein RecO (recombination protein O)
MNRTRRLTLEPAFLLHQRPFQESGRIIEFFTQDHGRVCLFARGVRREKSALSPVLQPFKPLLVSWAGSGDGGALTGAELAGPPAMLSADVLMSAFYLNELLLKLLGREDPHPEIYAAYATALLELSSSLGQARALRLFEKRLLEALGVSLDYSQIAGSGEQLDPNEYYHVRFEQGVLGPVARSNAGIHFQGRELLSLAAEELTDEASLAAAKRVLRAALDLVLDGRTLTTRDVARAIFDGRTK